MKVTRDEGIIVTNQLTLGFKHQPLLENISINIREGEFIGILGPNGSGKSTFLRALLGLINPLAGQLYIFDKKPLRGNTAIGYMPQMRKYTLSATLTSRAILEATDNGTHYGLPIITAEKKYRVQKLLELVNADQYADRPFSYLSGGEKQRIYLAQSLLGDPRILLLDEPLANLDPKIQKKFIDLLKQIQQTFAMTILFTAHDPNPLIGVMDRVLYFAQGKAAIGDVHDIITTETLSALYGLPIEVISYKGRLLVMGDGQHLDSGAHHHG